MSELAMEMREFNPDGRTIIGRVVPYDETTYMIIGGERIMRGAFTRSIQNRGTLIPLLRGHQSTPVYGVSQSFTEDEHGLIGEFRVNDGELGDALISQVRDGYLPGMSVGFNVMRNGQSRANDGVAEVREAKLVEVSLVGIPAYSGAKVSGVRNADVAQYLAPFENLPVWDLDPLPPFVYRARRNR